MFLSASKKDFYIQLKNDRFFFPGDVIEGDVVVDLAKPTRTNSVRVTFAGEVQSDGNVEELCTQTFHMATSTDDNERSHVLEAKTHLFPFKFLVPRLKPELPSSAIIPKLGSVKYTISALHDKPYTLDNWSPQAKVDVNILERIDVREPDYCVKGEYIEDIALTDAGPDQKARVIVSDVLPVTITVKHHRGFIKVNAVRVELIRRTYTKKSKNQWAEQQVIKTSLRDLVIPDTQPNNQVVLTKLMVPTSTPPTIGDSGRIFRVEYVVRVQVNLNEDSEEEEADNPKNMVIIPIKIILGTCPKPELEIDDEEEDEEEVVVEKPLPKLVDLSIHEKPLPKPVEPAVVPEQEVEEKGGEVPKEEEERAEESTVDDQSIPKASNEHVDFPTPYSPPMPAYPKMPVSPKMPLSPKMPVTPPMPISPKMPSSSPKMPSSPPKLPARPNMSFPLAPSSSSYTTDYLQEKWTPMRPPVQFPSPFPAPFPAPTPTPSKSAMPHMTPFTNPPQSDDPGYNQFQMANDNHHYHAQYDGFYGLPSFPVAMPAPNVSSNEGSPNRSPYLPERVPFPGNNGYQPQSYNSSSTYMEGPDHVSAVARPPPEWKISSSSHLPYQPHQQYQ
ncbi:hypothetical protein CLU79DRAFT_834367 [Phycomyces nitens]|nr:hypothetical protein CLU79DRAFT_834367 [Phycomyces nitens]